MTPNEIPYEQGTPPEWEQRIGRLTATAVGGLALVGPCPRCGDALRKDLRELAAPAAGLAVAGRRIVVRVVCNCTAWHAGRPDGVLGCGAEGGLELEY